MQLLNIASDANDKEREREREKKKLLEITHTHTHTHTNSLINLFLIFRLLFEIDFSVFFFFPLSLLSVI